VRHVDGRQRRGGLSYEDTLYAVPFYGESAITMYRTDLLSAAGMEMPESPTWAFIGEAARAMTDRDAEINGICLRGKAGWGENMGFISALANSYGARWFDENWVPQLDSPEWQEAFNFYVDVMKDAGPQGASSNGFNENLTLFQQGKCGMWMDASVAAGFVTGPDSTIADSVGFALFPTKEGVDNHGNWLWSWNLAIPASSTHLDAAKTFVSWATSQDYAALVADKLGWALAPPGTRTSLYENADYQSVAPFAEITLTAMQTADITNPSVQDVPYTGGQFVAIPEWQSIGTTVGQIFSAAVAGQTTADEALAQAQSIVTREMTRAGYIK
jgi:sorbitol/mannitol transport system substrate-binding protein